ncbi:hypothetical protein FSP39_008146 [Pinctada imbricata]|uniref:Tyr recombinase domain-containing protein n=1 Tax=Pinctada imbricata TaxID=66713 RepID=A0AA89C8M0_PINIB|nr:hypothetical protein FSP39_008146 [Pinctada imbricata]
MTTEEVQTSDQPSSIPAGSESINDIQINLANYVNTPLVLKGTSFKLGFNVDVSIRNKIIEGKYIDLALLLKTDANASMSNSFQLSPSGELIIKPKTNQKIATIARWTDAFLTFSSIYLSAHPNKTQEILKYMHDVRVGAERGGNFIKYDEQFRLRQSFEPSASWENIDSELWLIQKISPIWPPNLVAICNFIGYLSLEGQAASTARSYVSGISFKCKTEYDFDPTNAFVIAKLLEGFKRTNPTTDSRKPITLQILHKIIEILPVVCHNRYETKLFASAFTLAFHGFLRVGELAIGKGNSKDTILAINDITFSKMKMVIHIRKSKTDQHGRGAVREITATYGLEFLEIRPAFPGPFYCHFGGLPLTSYQFASVLTKSIKAIGLDPKFYKTHSFRIGAASDASSKGESPVKIQKAGRWKSKCYKTYIRQ